MIPNDQTMWQLHVRFAGGETLTADEQRQLEAWYEEQDRIESAEIVTSGQTSSVVALQTQVDDLLAKIEQATEHIRRLNAENERLRREVAELRQQLAQRAALALV